MIEAKELVDVARGRLACGDSADDRCGTRLAITAREHALKAVHLSERACRDGP